MLRKTAVLTELDVGHERLLATAPREIDRFCDLSNAEAAQQTRTFRATGSFAASSFRGSLFLRCWFSCCVIGVFFFPQSLSAIVPMVRESC